ncbi:MAG TPA: alpha/beta hydrolase fold domain-containing protein [Rhizomicrobium sp.]|jgi:acetyl esterase|nr:alpha/beta hydrolase fold domain-containing protein [Rhizomicrobium sp.]
MAAAEDIDPQIREFVNAINGAYASFGYSADRTYAESRAIAEKVRAPWRQGGPVMAETRERDIPTPHGAVRVRLHKPTKTAPLPAFFYNHGGGWTLFSLETHDRVMREYAARSGACVIGIDYALSPEAKFPVALEQIVAVVRWFRDHGAELGIDGTRLAIGGDSAGGNLSLSTSLKLRDCGEGSTLKGLLLIYGAFDSYRSREAAKRYGGDDYNLTDAECAVFWDNYIGGTHGVDSPLAQPMLADLTGLPPVLLTVGECDVLAEQSDRMAERLRAADVQVRLDVYPGATHSFIEAMSISELANRALDEGAHWLAQILATKA